VEDITCLVLRRVGRYNARLAVRTFVRYHISCQKEVGKMERMKGERAREASKAGGGGRRSKADAENDNAAEMY
jgi:hypothetical protein